MKIVIAAATALEWKPIEHAMRTLAQPLPFNIQYCTCGVGILPAVFRLQQWVVTHQPAIIIMVGIAGTFYQQWLPGWVVAIESETMGDVGVEENDVFSDVFDMKLSDPNEAPFKQKQLINPWLPQLNVLGLPQVNAITISEISTRPHRIAQLQQKYQPAVESMEGAALHYVGLQTGIPFLQLRAISNAVGDRDKSRWHIQSALQQLTEQTVELLQHLQPLT